jgi:transposase
LAFFPLLRESLINKKRHKDETWKMAKSKDVFRLTGSQRKKIEKRREQESDKRIFRRLSALLWLDDGCSQEEVARLLGTRSRTIRRWIKAYRETGLDGLCVIANEGRKCTLTEAQLEKLTEQVEAGSFRTAKQARHWIADNFDVKYSLSATKELLRRLGATYHRTTPFLFKADPEKQKKFAPLSAAETQGQVHTTLLPGWRASGLGCGIGALPLADAGPAISCRRGRRSQAAQHPGSDFSGRS